MDAQTDRGGLRLDEDHRRAAQNPLPGRARVQWHAYLVAAAYNLLRIARLAPAPA